MKTIRKNQFKVMLSDKELEELRNMATNAHLPVSTLLRMLINAATEGYKRGYNAER